MPPVAEVIGLSHEDRLLLFLPISNFQQRMMYYAAIWYDFDIIITDYTQLYPAMKALQPTVLIAPPIFYQLVHARFSAPGFERLAPPAWRGAVVPAAGRGFAPRACRSLVFKDVYALFGGKMRLLISGMAPLNRNICQFFDRMRLPLCESYGMVEAGSLTYRPPFSTSMDRWESRCGASPSRSRRMARSSFTARNS